jgi:hypothetical protein
MEAPLQEPVTFPIKRNYTRRFYKLELSYHPNTTLKGLKALTTRTVSPIESARFQQS